MNLSVIDVIFILLISLFMIRCFLKGFISEVLSMAAIILGLYASIFFYKNGAEFLRENYMPDSGILSEIVAFIALFLIIFIVVKLLEIMLKGIIRGVKLGSADRFLGLIFGFAEGIVVVSLVIFILQIIKPIYDSTDLLSDSIFASFLLPLITGTEMLKQSVPIDHENAFIIYRTLPYV